MKPTNITTALCAALLGSAIHTASAAAANWPQFRGPNTSGVSDDGRPPIHFGPDTNLLWKTAVPGGLSAPVVWGEKIFLTALENKQLITVAYDSRSGRELWRRIAPTETIEPCHQFSSPAASTPCTDGQHVYAYFGSFGVVAYDFAGKEIWRHPFERLPSEYGTASSPILAGGQLILQRDGVEAAHVLDRAARTFEFARIGFLLQSRTLGCHRTKLLLSDHEGAELEIVAEDDAMNRFLVARISA